MNQKVEEISEKLFRTKYEQLGKQEKHVAHHLAERTHIAKNVAQDFSEQLTFGQRLADKAECVNKNETNLASGQAAIAAGSGLLIHTSPGSSGGTGTPRTKRSGCCS